MNVRAGYGVAAVLCGCGASMMVKGPVTDQCSGAGLRGCDGMVEGVMMILDGKTADGAAKIKAAAAANPPDKVRAYAKGLRAVGSLPGAEKIADVATMLDDAAGPAASAPAGAKSDEKAASAQHAAPPHPGDDPAAMRAATVIPATPGRSTPCEPFGRSLEAAGAPSSCTRAFVGPVVVTDVTATGGCPGEIFVVAGSLEAPQWFLLVPPNAPYGAHGARFIVPTDIPLTIGVRGSPALRRDVRCAVTWAGYRPVP